MRVIRRYEGRKEGGREGGGMGGGMNEGGREIPVIDLPLVTTTYTNHPPSLPPSHPSSKSVGTCKNR